MRIFYFHFCHRICDYFRFQPISNPFLICWNYVPRGLFCATIVNCIRVSRYIFIPFFSLFIIILIDLPSFFWIRQSVTKPADKGAGYRRLSHKRHRRRADGAAAQSQALQRAARAQRHPDSANVRGTARIG